MLKEHLEFFTLDLSSGWETPPGYPQGIQQKIITGYLDEKKKKGSRTRLLRFKPGPLQLNHLNMTIGKKFFRSREI